MTKHNPRPGENYEVQPHDDGRWHVKADVHGRQFEGVLKIKLDANGEPDGYDWTGPDLDDDTMQEVLDLFAE